MMGERMATNRGGEMELMHLSWVEAREAIREAGVALLPVGAVEQHGPHLPLGTDWYIASRIAALVAQSDRRLLLPGLRVGVSREHRQFWGTLAISPEQLHDQAIAIARSLAAHSLRRLVFVNGHGSNAGPLEQAARDLREEGIFAYVFNWWQSIAALVKELFPDRTAHAGSIETSLMLAIHPELVRADRFSEAGPADRWGTYVEGVLVGFDAIDFTEQGNVGDPKLAEGEKGRAVLSAACDSLSRFGRWLADRTEEELAQRSHLP
jgi:creatinine amidohydrolase